MVITVIILLINSHWGYSFLCLTDSKTIKIKATYAYTDYGYVLVSVQVTV